MDKKIKELVAPLGIQSLTPIQEKALDSYRNSDELILYSPTGSGKTLAFLLPLIQMMNPGQEGVQAVILSPTRELALQIESVFKSLKTSFSITSCYGGHSMRTEVNNLSENPNVIVATPGRLCDHINRGNVWLDDANYFIVDEFDKCLEFGFQEDIDKIYRRLKRLKKLIFGSATKIEEFPSFIRLKNPTEIDVTNKSQEPEIAYHYIDSQDDDFTIIANLIIHFNNEPAIIFCNFRDDVEELAFQMEELGYAVTPYHGAMGQDERERALIKFRNKSCPVLICTDLGARGLDIPEVKHIVHFQLPDKEDAFIHRNGRTARMAAHGKVYLLKETNDRFELPKATPLQLKNVGDYIQPEYTTVYFSGGKKNKINKIDLLGFICQKGGLDKSDIGVIAVLDFASYVAIKSDDIYDLLRHLRQFKVKGKKLRIAVSK